VAEKLCKKAQLLRSKLCERFLIMKKHILGIALFVSIAGIIGIAFSVFIPDETIICEFPVNPAKYRDQATRTNFPLVKQVVLDLKTKQIAWEFTDNELKTSISLHFYTVDSKGSRYLKTEYARTTSDLTNSYSWLNGLKSYENLYVIADDYPDTHRSMSSIPAFEMSIATPVLLSSGKQAFPKEK
jgi:hypothetical protein